MKDMNKAKETAQMGEYCPYCKRLRIKNLFGCHCNGLLQRLWRYLFGN